jgi:hypothetical protein
MSNKTQAIQNKVEECKNQLHDNVQLALDRQIQIEIYAKIVNEKNVEITYTEEHNPNKIIISFDDKKTATQFLKALHFCISFQCGDDSIWTFIDSKVLFFNYCQYLKVEKNKITIKYNSDICTNGVHVINF